MARVRAGRYPGVRKDCEIVERYLIVRDRTGLTPVKMQWCETHLCWLLTCETCGRTFHTVRTHTKHCSTGCSQYAYRQRVKNAEVRA